MPPAALTWIFDSGYVDVALAVGGAAPETVADRRVLINSRHGARLYGRNTTSPLRRLEDATYGSGSGQWLISGTNPETEAEEQWTVRVIQRKIGCGGCGR